MKKQQTKKARLSKRRPSRAPFRPRKAARLPAGPRPRPAPAAGLTPGLCYAVGTHVTEAEYRAVLALAAAKAHDRATVANEMAIALYDVNTVKRVVPACAANRDTLAKLAQDAELAMVNRNTALARSHIRQAITVIRACAEKAGDRCDPERIPTAPAGGSESGPEGGDA